MLFTCAVKAQTPDASKASSWQKYTVDGAGCSVALPALPAMHVSEKFLEGIEKGRRQVLLGSYAEGAAYVVYTLENPNPQQSLRDFIAARTGSIEWKLNNGREVSRDGYAGKVFLSVEPDDGMIQYFASENRLYEFRAFGAAAEDARLTKFFSSISFGKTEDAVNVKEGDGTIYQPAVQPGATNDESAKPLLGKEVTKKFRLAMKPEPSYTQLARDNAVTGTVVLKCIFKSDGSVQNIRPVTGLPYGLTERAMAAARRIRFIPAVKNGKFVSMWVQLEYNFNLY
jgi:TonB family protein